MFYDKGNVFITFVLPERLVGNTGREHKLHKVPLIEMHVIKKESVMQFVPFFYCFLSLNMNTQSTQLMTKST